MLEPEREPDRCIIPGCRRVASAEIHSTIDCLGGHYRWDGGSGRIDHHRFVDKKTEYMFLPGITFND